MSVPPGPGQQPWRVKFDGPCARCGITLVTGTPAVWDRRRRERHCIECPRDVGTPGGSARGRYEAIAARREADVKGRWGERLGGAILRFADEPQSIRAWGLGARGEEILGSALAAVDGLIVLNDRRVAGTRGNIDHIAIGPAGVFVLDAKLYAGFIEVVDKGSFLRSDLRLRIGGRDKSDLAEKMGWQLKAVNRALFESGLDPMPPVTAVLCFVEPSWAIFRHPKSFAGVRIESEKSIVRVLAEPRHLSTDQVENVAAVLAAALPAKP